MNERENTATLPCFDFTIGAEVAFQRAARQPSGKSTQRFPTTTNGGDTLVVCFPPFPRRHSARVELPGFDAGK